MRHLSFLMMLLFFSACSQQDMLQKFSSPEQQATAKGYIDQLRAHDLGPIESAADPKIRGPNLHGTLLKMAALIPARQPTSIKLVGAQTSYQPGLSMVNTTFEYDFGDSWLLANVAIQDKSGIKTIVGFNINPELQPLEQQNRFTLSGKSPAQYLILLSAIFAALLTLFSLVLCVRTKLDGRKWAWILFIVLGFGELAVNWTTGQWRIHVLAVQLFSASALAPLYGPWTISASFPLGAIWFLFHRRKALAKRNR